MTFSYIVIGMAVVIVLLILKSRFASFTAQSPNDYPDGPVFNIQTVLNGPMDCEGVIYGPTGRVASRFVARFEGSWDGNVGTLREVFDYDSGTRQERQWSLRLGNDGRIQATAPDVIGTGEGIQNGSAVRLKYRIKLTEDAGGHELDTVDWMYLMPNGTIINRSQFRKFGIKVAELVATMRPSRGDAGMTPGE
ncbi:DUF3833 domain-containing protein [Salibaculum griseiflavum]|jgi:hypothetical protein|uniref:DUF3833 domain-containing protein n=1 Tax=Salibaculum griseiflavum TaxID=1914409 RepID=A0A2V1P3H7_9RHOB|nr:DUF3833 domain-containing protein [Salibaculum griseiflavum]PWG16308.1 DUF3833 domain-containing protein [Salibaculum griseiflavum]